MNYCHFSRIVNNWDKMFPKSPFRMQELHVIPLFVDIHCEDDQLGSVPSAGVVAWPAMLFTSKSSSWEGCFWKMHAISVSALLILS